MGFGLKRAESAEDLAALKAVYEEAFPPVERFAFDALIAADKAGLCEVRGAFDDGDPVGLCVTASDDDVVYVAYLAMDQHRRSKGYGARTLAAVFDEAGERPVMLDVEPVGRGAANEQQRTRRMAFYKRNGFVPTDCFLVEDGESYQVLCHGGFSKDKLHGLFQAIDDQMHEAAPEKMDDWAVEWSLSTQE